jgi:glycine cleavage system transcriptional repressor
MFMRRWYMLTVVGRDRPGIVAGLTDLLFQAGANLGEASMVRLGGSFTVMLMVQFDGDAAALTRILDPLVRELDLRLHVDAIEGKLHAHVEPNARVTVHGADRPGIVAQVTAALKETGFNILDLESDVGGTDAQPFYIMTIDGYSSAGAAALESALAPLRAQGIEVRVTALDLLLG